ncbi:DUF7507 domain-containing protein, partial [Polynucleobacter sinensis]|uniref:DUF7507 domain-containing protein n=1 Tax=Polynucleobacter sinensis TaxID=1743157 RepID=UPI000A3FB33C
ISQTDFDAIGRSSDGDIDNTVVATASETLGSESVLSASEEVEVILSPELRVAKSAIAKSMTGESLNNGALDDHLTLDTNESQSVNSAGQYIDYQIEISNIGNTTLTGVSILDGMFSDPDVYIASVKNASGDEIDYHLIGSSISLDNPLQVQETIFINYALNINLDDLLDSTIENIASARSVETDQLSKTYSANYSVIVDLPQSDIALRKFANVESVEGVGSTVTYTLYIVNEGETNLTNIKIEDSMVDNTVVLSVNLHDINSNTTSPTSYSFEDGLIVLESPLGVGQFVTISYNHIVTEADFVVSEVGIEKHIFDYASPGDKLDIVDMGYGTFSAYVNSENVNPYAINSDLTSDTDIPAKLFFNVDNTGLAVGVNAGVMSGDRDGNSDHLKAVFNPNQLNGGKSAVEGVSVVFTNAKSVELAFTATYGLNSDKFTGSILISERGDVSLKELNSLGKLEGNTTFSDGVYKFIGVNSLHDGWFTVSQVNGPGGAQNKIYTLNFTPSDSYANSFDFFVVGDLLNNSVEQIKVVDVAFDTKDFYVSNVVNTASVYSLEDNSLDQSDEISVSSLTVLSNISVEAATIAASLGENNFTILDTYFNIMAMDNSVAEKVSGLKLRSDSPLSSEEIGLLQAKFSDLDANQISQADLPTVTAQITNDTTPIVSGTAVLGAGEVLAVTVGTQVFNNVAVSG